MKNRSKLEMFNNGTYTLEHAISEMHSEFSYKVFATLEECDNFIWNYCFEKRRMYFNPITLNNKTYFIEYQK